MIKRWLRILEYEGTDEFIRTAIEKRAVIGQKILPEGSIREAMIGEFPVRYNTKTREEVEKLMEDFEDFLNVGDADAIEGRLLKWLGLEE